MINRIEKVTLEEIQSRREREVERVQHSIEYFEYRIAKEGPNEKYEASLAKRKQDLEDLNDEKIWVPRFTTSIVLERVDEYLHRKAEEMPALKTAADSIRAEWYRTCVDGTIECVGDVGEGLKVEDMFEHNQPQGLLSCVSNLDHARSFLKAHKEKALS